MPTPIPINQQTPPKLDETLDHIYCCVNPDIGLCGSDLTDMLIADLYDVNCVVCSELNGATTTCPVYGRLCPHD